MRPNGTGTNGDRELGSWKEIAQVLGISVRTAQIWERERGLPVYRVPGPGGRVRALVSELEAWKRSASTPGNGVEDKAGRLWRRAWIRPVVAGLLVLAVIVGATAYWLWHRNPPAAYRVEQNTLVVLDAASNRLWHHEFDVALQTRNYDHAARDNQLVDPVWIGDLDGDGAREVVFCELLARGGRDVSSGRVVCFDAQGNTRWEWQAGGTVTKAGQAVANLYDIVNLVVEPMGDQRKRVLVVAAHDVDEPTQVALLSDSGKLLSEYWHSGHVGDLRRSIQLHDFDGDGTTDVCIAGVNNARKQATVLVLDPRGFQGASAENTDYQLTGPPPSTGVTRILFPRSCMNLVAEYYNYARVLSAHADALTVHVEEVLGPPGSSIIYTITRAHTVTAAPSDAFIARHKQWTSTGRLDHDTTKQEWDALAAGVHILSSRSLP